MDLEQFRKGLVWRNGYKGTNNQDLKVFENSILESVSTYFRPIEKGIHVMPVFSNQYDGKDIKEKVLQEIDNMKQVSNNFYINELVVSFMSKAHNDWILAHIEELENNQMKNPEKFVPLELLTNKEIEEYLSVITPIFNSINIDIDEQEVKKVFSKQQLIFMIKNELFSDNYLTERIMDINKINPELSGKYKNEEKSIEDIYAQKDVAIEIAKHVKPRINLCISDKFREVLSQNNEIGFFEKDKKEKEKLVYKFTDTISQKKIGFKKHAMPRPEKPVSKAIYQLAKSGVIFVKNVKTSDYKYYDYSNNANQFIEYQKCSEDQKRAIARRERKLEKMANKINRNSDAEIPGVVTMVIVRKDAKFPVQNYLKEEDRYYPRETEIIQIPITQKELIEMKVLPDEVGWEKDKKAKILSNKKTFFATTVRKVNEKNEFKDSLKIDNNKNINQEKINTNTEQNNAKENEEKNR